MDNKDKLVKILSDPVLFSANFCKIVDKESKLVPFILNPQQEDFVRNIDRFNIILKSRQIGFSVANALLAIFYCCTMPNIHCLLASYTLDSANTIYDKLKTIYYSIPSGIKPKEIQNNRKELAFFNGSKITVTTIGNKDCARGSSLFFVHLSEWGMVKDSVASKQLVAIEEALLPNGHLVIESTANGCNHLYEEWNKAENGENLYKPFFYGWIESKDAHKQEYDDYSKRYKAIHGKHLDKSELDDTELEYLERGATLQQLEWRRLKIANTNEKSFNQEMPADPILAFQSSGSSVFDAKRVQQQYDYAKKIKPLDNIPLLPTVLKPYFKNQLTVWEEPQKNLKYYISCDSAEGLGGTCDYTVIDVYSQDGIQMAQFRSNKTAPYLIADILYAIGIWYNKAIIGVEKASTGGLILTRLKMDLDYRNIAKSKEYDAFGRAKKKIGITTSAKSKPIMIGKMQQWFDNGDIVIRSIQTLAEMKTYQFDGTSTNAVTGLHDDTVMACAIGINLIENGIQYLW